MIEVYAIILVFDGLQNSARIFLAIKAAAGVCYGPLEIHAKSFEISYQKKLNELSLNQVCIALLVIVKGHFRKVMLI